MRPFGKLLLLGLLAFSCTVIHGQFAGFRPGRIGGFGWARGTYKLVQNVSINQMTFTGPADSLYYDVTVMGTDIYKLPPPESEVGDGYNGAGEFGYVIASGYTPPLQGPGPMNQAAQTNTLGPWFWSIPNEGRLHNVRPDAGYFLVINLYSENPAIDPNAFLVQRLGDDRVFIDVQCDLFVTGLDFSAGSYVGGDFITLTVSLMNGSPFTFPPGMAETPNNPVLQTRPISPLAPNRIDFRLTLDPRYDPPGGIADDFALHSITIFGDGKNGQDPPDSWLNPAETVTVTTDALLPRNFPGIYYLGTEIDAANSNAIRDIDNSSDILVSPDTARVQLLSSNSPYTHPVSEITSPNGNLANTANEYSEDPSLSGNGSRIAFISRASNLTGDSNGLTDVFVRHRDTGNIQLVSVNSNGSQANRNSQQPAISAEGTYVAFASQATNLVKEDIGGFSDIFVHNVETGETVRISKRIEQKGDIFYTVEPDGSSYSPSISEDGRFIAFSSFAKNLDPSYDGLFPIGGVSIRHIYVHDRCVDGDQNRFDKDDNVATYLVSCSVAGDLSNDNSFAPSISLDGQWIAFGSLASNLGIPDFYPNSFQQVFRRMLFDGFASKTPHGLPEGVYSKSPSHDDHLASLELLSVDVDGNPGNSDSYDPAIDGDGDEIAFVSEADHLDARMSDSNGVPDIFVRSFQDFDVLGVASTVRVSISSGGNEALDVTGSGNVAQGSLMPSIDRSGRYIAFRSHADNITHLSPLFNGASDIFLHDRDFDGNGLFDEVSFSGVLTEVISVNRFGYATRSTTVDPSASSRNPSVSADGRFVAFTSDSGGSGGLRFGRTNMFPLDSNSFRDIYLYDQNTNVQPAELPERHPPYVMMLDPNNGDQFAAGSTFFIRAYATDISGITNSTAGIEKVELLVNGDIISVDFSEPYSTTYTAFEEGSYSIRARATDKDGYITFSDPVKINTVITPSRLPEIELPYPRDGQEFLPNRDVPFMAEIIGDPNIPGATFQALDFYVDGLSVAAGVQQPGGLYQAVYRFLTSGEQNLNAVVQYQSTVQPGVTIQTISNTVMVNILSETGSVPPTVQILYPADRSSLTSASSIRLLAEASDPDGNLIGVQFYVNGVAYGNEVLRTPSHTPTKFPFGIDWSPGSSGTFEITAVARDSSGNFATSFPIRVNSATGVDPPTVQFTQPFTPPVVTTIVEGGVIDSIDLVHGKEGNGFFKEPEVVITGQRDEAVFTISESDIQNGGIGPDPSDGSGVTLQHRGSGYVRTPSVIIVGDGTGAKAFAQRDAATKSIQEVIVRSPGQNYTSARVSFSGGHDDADADAILGDLGGGIQSFNLLDGGSGYISGSIAHVSVTKTGSEFRTAPNVYISPPPNEDKGGKTATAEAEINIEGQVRNITVTDGGSGYDTIQTFSGTSFTFSSADNTLSSPDSDFVLFLQSLVRSGDFLDGELLYDTLTIVVSDDQDKNAINENDGEYSIVAVSATGLEVFPNLVELEDVVPLTVTLRADPKPPSVTILGGEGSGARAKAVVTAPSVTFREVRPIRDAQTSQAKSPILLTVNAEDEGVVTRTEFYANGVLIPSSLADSAYWTPQNTGIFEVVAIAIDDDGNSTSSIPIEFRITEAESSLPVIELVSPRSTIEGQTPAFAVSSSIDLTASAFTLTGSITKVDFYANSVLIGTSTNPVGPQDSEQHFTVSWSPANPGTYSVTAYATDSLDQVAGLDSPQSIKVETATGSTPPTIDLVYPQPSMVTTSTTDPLTGLVTISTQLNPTYITDSSSIRLAAIANDPDGGLYRVRFYINGEEVRAITGYLKLDDNVPEDGDTIQFDDGENSAIFEFDSNDYVFPGRVGVPIGTDIATARNNLVEALKLSEKSEDLKLKAYPVGTAGVFLEHTDPEDLGAGSLALDIIADFQHSSNIWTRGLKNGVVRFPTTNPQDHPFSIEVETGPREIIKGPDVYTILAVAEDNTGNKVMSSAVSITCTEDPEGEAPTVSLSPVSENNLVIIPPPNASTTPVVNPLLPGATTTTTDAWVNVYVEEIDDADGEITQVEFFVNGQSIGIDYEGRHQMRWTPTDIGFYEIHAHAHDDRGNITTTDVQKLLVAHQGSVDGGYTDGGTSGGEGNGPIVGITYPKLLSYPEVGKPYDPAKHGKRFQDDPDEVFDINSGPYTVNVHAEPRVSKLYVIQKEGETLSSLASSNEVSVEKIMAANPELDSSQWRQLQKGQEIVMPLSGVDPYSLVQRVEIIGMARPGSIAVVNSFPYSGQFNPTSLGMYFIKAIAYDISGNSTESEPVIVRVVDETETGIFEEIEDEKPFIDLMSPLDGTELTVGKTLDLVAMARPGGETGDDYQTHTIQRVDFYANGRLIGSSANYPYGGRFTPTSYGDYEFVAIVTDIKGVTNTSKTVTVHVIEDPLTRPTIYLNPFSTDLTPNVIDDDDYLREGDFVLAVYRDLVWLNPTSGEYKSMVNDLVYGRITREGLVEVIMKGPFYGSFRDMTMAQFVLKQLWPDREEALFNYSLSEKGVIETPPPVNTLDVLYPDPELDTMVSTMVGMVDFGLRNPLAGAAPAGAQGINNTGPKKLSGLQAVVEYYQTTAFDLTYGSFDEKENDEFFELLFFNKYGVKCTPLQCVRGTKVMNDKFEQMGGIIDPSKISYGGGNNQGRGNNNNNNIFGNFGNNNNNNNLNFEDQNLRTLHEAKRFILQDFIRDNTFVEAGALTYTEDMKIAYPPNSRLVELADANALNTSIMRQAASLASNQEIRDMGTLADQILYAINSEEFINRFNVQDSTADTPWYGAESVGDGWMNLDWFGLFYYDLPWIYHNELGWIYNSTGTPYDIWMWIDTIGWCWTSKEQYPYLYSLDHDWLYYDRGSGNMFYSYQNEEWLKF